MRFIGAFLVLLLGCRLAFSFECPVNLIKRTVSTEDDVITRCCQPLGHTECPPGTEVKPCNKTSEPEWCKPCDSGLVQEFLSGTGNERQCILPANICTPEADLVLVDGIQECQCRAAEGYCGKSRDCLKVEKTCPEGFQLHHRDCNCTQIVTATPTTVSGTGTSMLPRSSTTSPPSSSDPAPTTKAASQQNETKSEDKKITDEEPPLQEDENKEVLPTGPNGSTNQSAVIAISVGIGIVAVLAAVLWFLWRTRGRNNTTCNVHVAIRNRLTNVFIQVPPDVEKRESSESLVGTADPPAEVPGEARVTMTAVQEERDPQPEQGSMGAAPDETLLKRSGSFCQELNTRNSVEMV